MGVDPARVAHVEAAVAAELEAAARGCASAVLLGDLGFRHLLDFISSQFRRSALICDNCKVSDSPASAVVEAI